MTTFRARPRTAETKQDGSHRLYVTRTLAFHVVQCGFTPDVINLLQARHLIPSPHLPINHDASR